MERMVRLAVTALVGFLPAGGLALGSVLGAPRSWLVASVSLATVALIAGWPAWTRLPQPHTARLTLFLTGVVAIGLAAFGPEGGAFVLVAIALGFPAVFLRELARPAPREDLVRSVTGTTCGVVAVAAMGLWVTAGVMEHFVDLAIEAGTGIAAACLGIGLGRLAPRWKGEIGAGLGLLLAVGAGAGVSFLVVTPWWAGAAVAAVCAVAPGGLGLIGESRSVLAARLSLSDAAVFTLPLAVASVPVWAAALMR